MKRKIIQFRAKNSQKTKILKIYCFLPNRKWIRGPGRNRWICALDRKILTAAEESDLNIKLVNFQPLPPQWLGRCGAYHCAPDDKPRWLPIDELNLRLDEKF